MLSYMANDNKPTRDPKTGRLLPGHKPFVVERSPGKNLGGRPKEFKTQVKDALKLAEDAMPDIIASMIDRATGRDPDCDVKTRQAASEYLIDRIYGKANQPLTHNAEPKFVELLSRLRNVGTPDKP